MSKLLFVADTENIYDASVYTLGPNQVRLVFSNAEVKPADAILLSGFNVINEYNHSIIEASYTDYIYSYRDTGDDRVVELDNNNVPWTPEPEPPVPPVPPTPEPPTLAEVLADKIQEFSDTCRNYIEGGVDLYIGGIIEHFSYYLSGGDQNNIDDIFNTMTQTLSGEYYHCDGGICKLYTPAQVFYIYFANKLNTQDNVTYYNLIAAQLHELYDNAEDTEENREIVSSLVYKAYELIGQYKVTYDAVIAQGIAQMNTVKAKLEEAGVDFSEHIYPVTVDEAPNEEENSEEESEE